MASSESIGFRITAFVVVTLIAAFLLAVLIYLNQIKACGSCCLTSTEINSLLIIGGILFAAVLLFWVWLIIRLFFGRKPKVQPQPAYAPVQTAPAPMPAPMPAPASMAPRPAPMPAPMQAPPVYYPGMAPAARPAPVYAPAPVSNPLPAGPGAPAFGQAPMVTSDVDVGSGADIVLPTGQL